MLYRCLPRRLVLVAFLQGLSQVLFLCCNCEYTRCSGLISEVTALDGENGHPDATTAATWKPPAAEIEPGNYGSPTADEEAEGEAAEADGEATPLVATTGCAKEGVEKEQEAEATGSETVVTVKASGETGAGKVAPRARVAVKIQQVPLDEVRVRCAHGLILKQSILCVTEACS